MRTQTAGVMAVALMTMVSSCTKQERGGGNGEHPKAPITDDTPPQVSAVLSAVTLADDCAHADASESERKRNPNADQDITEAESQARRAQVCTQTSLQLNLIASKGGKNGRADVKLIKVELIDTATGKTMGQLTPRNPRLWADAAGNYQVWNQSMTSGEQAKVMFDLSAPDWSPIGGRFNAAGKVFRLQATISAGGAESTTTKEVSVEAPEVMVDPMIET